MPITEINIPAAIRRDFIYNLTLSTPYQEALHTAAIQFSESHCYNMDYKAALHHLSEYAVCFGYEPIQ